ncbi:MAG TPA: DUF4198 domain-containing protein [Steroidobacteraceae bacterium]|nr:DUF4198 domain-containing protein [Steroidobacteraceae bacterium]
MSRPKSLIFALATFATGLMGPRPGEAHDFWVQPGDYWVRPGAGTSVTLLVGHGPGRQRSLIPAYRIVRFEAVGPQGSQDLRPSLRLRGPRDDGTVLLRRSGSYLLVLQTDARAYSLLPAIRFNDYLRVEGLTPALLFRERTHRTNADGSEAYSRQAKTIIQVGDEPNAESPVTHPLGLALEIVPDVNPYAERCAKNLPLHVLYHGRPLPGALVKLTNLEHDANPIETHVTDENGQAVFSAPRRGDWLLNVIWTEVASASSDADFQTTFSSLSFGYNQSSATEFAVSGSHDACAVPRPAARSAGP